MSVFRLVIALGSILLVEGVSYYIPRMKLDAFWVMELGMLRLVVLGVVLCGLAVTGGARPRQAEEEPKPQKLRGLRNAPPERDAKLLQLADAFRGEPKPDPAMQEVVEELRQQNRELMQLLNNGAAAKPVADAPPARDDPGARVEE